MSPVSTVLCTPRELRVPGRLARPSNTTTTTNHSFEHGNPLFASPTATAAQAIWAQPADNLNMRPASQAPGTPRELRVPRRLARQNNNNTAISRGLGQTSSSSLFASPTAAAAQVIWGQPVENPNIWPADQAVLGQTMPSVGTLPNAPRELRIPCRLARQNNSDTAINRGLEQASGSPLFASPTAAAARAIWTQPADNLNIRLVGRAILGQTSHTEYVAH